jgi:hypothetical protein
MSCQAQKKIQRAVGNLPARPDVLLESNALQMGIRIASMRQHDRD